jgi:hypothetical protein
MTHQADVTIVIPFGKHRGKSIEECPSGYLRWLAGNLSEKPGQWQGNNKAIIAGCEKELRIRDKNGGHWEDER